ncbi:YceI family protein [Gluconobacter kondonii]|uniref:YceI family protein n=1 Tax=Gluconobacter kondonii TaxID=941463 RepID=UPI00197FF177|nr:YceI family protein [Gluconobacter kondonii]MBN3868167.1 polyisoprenoid-binding protein [Gluconobacter kondonii]MBS1078585.1 polyisoprenoid-binding protein [Gluconobacter kondonii]
MRFSISRAALLAISIAALPAVASAQTVTNPAQVQSGTYAIEPGHTQVEFSLLHFGFTYYSGAFSNVSGTLDLDAKTPSASKLSVTIPIASVQTTSDKLTDELKSDQWFDAVKFPNATFVSYAVKRIGKTDAIVTGNLTLHGVTKPETLKVHFVGAGINPMDKKYTAGFEATATIKRSDFGVKMYVPYVGDDVKLHIAGAFEKQN